MSPLAAESASGRCRSGGMARVPKMTRIGGPAPGYQAAHRPHQATQETPAADRALARGIGSGDMTVIIRIGAPGRHGHDATSFRDATWRCA